MKIIKGTRGSGKTTALIKMSSESGMPIITATSWMANDVMHRAKEMGLDIPEPLSINKVVNGPGRSAKRYLIDELALCLNQLGIEAETITISEEG